MGQAAAATVADLPGLWSSRTESFRRSVQVVQEQLGGPDLGGQVLEVDEGVMLTEVVVRFVRLAIFFAP